MRNLVIPMVAAIVGSVLTGCSSQDPSTSGSRHPSRNDVKQPVSQRPSEHPDDQTGKTATPVRFATFNVALNRKRQGQLVLELESGDSRTVEQVAEVIQRIRPDVILLNELDYDAEGRAVELFKKNFLENGQSDQLPIEYPYVYSGQVNTGVNSGVDINQDGVVALPDDGFGFGDFPGQYGMAVLSRFPIDESRIRTFGSFLWKDLPDALVPADPESGKPFFPDDVRNQMRLASKNLWDVPIRIGEQTVHFICSHPTPPVFDGKEDRNGCRNHDEIRMVANYVSGNADYLYDDHGVRGGLVGGSLFVVAGDMNADPLDGDSTGNAALLLTEHPDMIHSKTPASQGAIESAETSGRKNEQHQGKHAHDTADFNDVSVGNLRIDYCLPGKAFELVESGVFWPARDEPGFELNQASDHHLVWIDVLIK